MCGEGKKMKYLSTLAAVLMLSFPTLQAEDKKEEKSRDQEIHELQVKIDEQFEGDKQLRKFMTSRLYLLTLEDNGAKPIADIQSELKTDWDQVVEQRRNIRKASKNKGLQRYLQSLLDTKFRTSDEVQGKIDEWKKAMEASKEPIAALEAEIDEVEKQVKRSEAAVDAAGALADSKTVASEQENKRTAMLEALEKLQMAQLNNTDDESRKSAGWVTADDADKAIADLQTKYEESKKIHDEAQTRVERSIANLNTHTTAQDEKTAELEKRRAEVRKKLDDAIAFSASPERREDLLKMIDESVDKVLADAKNTSLDTKLLLTDLKLMALDDKTTVAEVKARMFQDRLDKSSGKAQNLLDKINDTPLGGYVNTQIASAISKAFHMNNMCTALAACAPGMTDKVNAEMAEHGDQVARDVFEFIDGSSRDGGDKSRVGKYFYSPQSQEDSKAYGEKYNNNDAVARQ